MSNGGVIAQPMPMGTAVSSTTYGKEDSAPTERKSSPVVGKSGLRIGKWQTNNVFSIQVKVKRPARGYGGSLHTEGDSNVNSADIVLMEDYLPKDAEKEDWTIFLGDASITFQPEVYYVERTREAALVVHAHFRHTNGIVMTPPDEEAIF